MDTLSFVMLMFTLVSSFLRYKHAFGTNLHTYKMYSAWSGSLLMLLYVLYLFYNMPNLNTICITVSVCILCGIGYDNLTNKYPGRGWISSIMAFIYIIFSLNISNTSIYTTGTFIWALIFSYNFCCVMYLLLRKTMFTTPLIYTSILQQ